MEITIPLAHAGHLLVDLPVFLGPIVLIACWLLIAAIGGRRRDRDRA